MRFNPALLDKNPRLGYRNEALEIRMGKPSCLGPLSRRIFVSLHLQKPKGIVFIVNGLKK